MASDIWLRTILIVRKETLCCHIGYSFRLAARVLLYAPSHRQDSTYHSLCYTSRGALAGTRNSSMGPPWRIDPTTHRTMSERSYHGATSRSSPVTAPSIKPVPTVLTLYKMSHIKDRISANVRLPGKPTMCCVSWHTLVCFQYSYFTSCWREGEPATDEDGIVL